MERLMQSYNDRATNSRDLRIQENITDSPFEVLEQSPGTFYEKRPRRKSSFDLISPVPSIRPDSEPLKASTLIKHGSDDTNGRTTYDQSKGVFSSVLKYGGNLFFNLEGRKHKWSNSTNTSLYGKNFKCSEKNEFQDNLKNVVWLTYRDEFKPLLRTDNKSSCYSSDRGWGCMLRAGQMMLAEVLKRNIFTIEGKYHKTMMENSLVKICEYFADVPTEPSKSPFSIHNITEEAVQAVRKQPGEWYTSGNIIHVLSRLLDKYDHDLPEIRLKTVLFVEGTIFEDQILEKAGLPIKDKRYKFNQRLSDARFSISTRPSVLTSRPGTIEEIKDECEEKDEGAVPKKITLKDAEWNHGIFVVVLTKTGLDSHNEAYLPTVKTLLNFKQSVGILSGIGDKAYYIIGACGNELLYLDPHYVQRAPKKREDVENMMHTYFVRNCQTMKLKELSTSVGFGFYFNSKKDYIDFKKDFMNAKKTDPDFLIGLEDETPEIPDYNSDDVIEIDDMEVTKDGFEVVD